MVSRNTTNSLKDIAPCEELSLSMWEQLLNSYLFKYRSVFFIIHRRIKLFSWGEMWQLKQQNLRVACFQHISYEKCSYDDSNETVRHLTWKCSAWQMSRVWITPPFLWLLWDFARNVLQVKNVKEFFSSDACHVMICKFRKKYFHSHCKWDVKLCI